MRVFLPTNNAGCLGIKVGRFYMDLSVCMGSLLIFGNFRGLKFYLSRKGYRRVS